MPELAPTIAPSIPAVLMNPPREYSVMPFWFWNDDLTEQEIRRQIADFDAHGVFGFVIHPRVGLPRRLAWMSDPLLRIYDAAIDEARRRDMYVLLYDEGMYPSGSSHGQVVATNPAFATRAMARVELHGDTPPALPDGHHLVTILQRTNGQRVAIVDRPANSRIRGVHFAEPGDPHPDDGPSRDGSPPESEPLAGDLLNPQAVQCFINLVHERFAERYQHLFGTTIRAMFTDEPNVLGKYRHHDLRPGTTGILEHVERILGYDFTPHLLTLWYDDEPNAARHRDDYKRAIHQRMNETYYTPLHDWCESHGLPLTGHPSASDDIAAQRYFQIPGQDTVWRMILPGPTATEGADATQAKCSSSAMIHLQRTRNANECCGAYGHNLTYAEMKWLTDWCLIRGVNLLIPHAFYYSVRGPRRDERPPDVGPNSAWWSDYRAYADGCRRLSWLNADGQHQCDVAILGTALGLPWRAAQVIQQHQRDFNYLEDRHLYDDAIVDNTGVHLAGMHYKAVIVDSDTHPDHRATRALRQLADAGRLISWSADAGADTLLDAIKEIAPADLIITPTNPGLRVRQIRKLDQTWLMLFNEGEEPISIDTVHLRDGNIEGWFDPYVVEPTLQPLPTPLPLDAMRMVVLKISHIVNDAARVAMQEDQEDLAACAERANEREISHEDLLKDLRSHGER